MAFVADFDDVLCGSTLEECQLILDHPQESALEAPEFDKDYMSEFLSKLKKCKEISLKNTANANGLKRINACSISNVISGTDNESKISLLR